MSIKDLKFNTADFSGKDISSLPDRPGDGGITGQQLKERFDQIPKMMVAMGGFNDLIDELNSTGGAENIGIAPIEGVSGTNAQAALVEMGTLTKAARVAAETAAQQGAAAQQAAENANAAADEATEKAAEAARAASTAAEQGNEAAAAAVAATAAIIEVKGYAAEQAQSAKDYVDQVILAGGAVTSVFGRAGEVKAQAGDYTADMVGARPNTWTPNADDVGARPNTWMPTAAEIGAAPSIHASQHASDGEDPITPASIGAVSKTGDTMTGNLTINKGTPTIGLVGDNRKAYFKSFSTGQAQIWTGAQDDTDNISLNLEPPSRNLGIASSLRLYIDKYYNLFGAHNKPSGSYTGNGSATQRSIPISALGSVVAVWGNNKTFSIVSNHGAICFKQTTSGDAGTISSLNGWRAYFTTSLVLSTNSEYLNASGVTYNYQVI